MGSAAGASPGSGRLQGEGILAYSELIKNFSRIRSYMRSFYVYGFRHRNEYDEKSARGYDNERRRMESWLLRSAAISQAVLISCQRILHTMVMSSKVWIWYVLYIRPAAGI